jgi:hypothetical protein
VRWATLLACLSLACACSGDDDEASEKPANPFKEQFNALEKARSMEKTLQDNADERARQIDKQTGQQ